MEWRCKDSGFQGNGKGIMKKSENEIAKIGFYRSFKSEILDFIVVYNIKKWILSYFIIDIFGFYRTFVA